ncbi:MAG TPA: MMPL family transporter [Gemmatimonadales bacterium]|nr:MMPL family transporter [Gemmatimonadales bacterium]
MKWFARAVVKFRWAVIALWVIVGTLAVVQARLTPERLDLRGGSTRETEAVRADRLLQARFSRSIGEFFAITFEAPVPVDRPGPAAILDSLVARMKREPYVRSVLSFTSTGDSLFISANGRTTFILVALSVPGKDAGAYVVPARRAVQRALAAFPDAEDYRATVTGRAALDLDIRHVSAEDSRRSELRVLPLTLMVLVLAFGALVAALLPVAVGILAIFVALALIGILALYTPMSVFVLNLTTMIGLGVGIDYSLLIVTRFREELKRGLRRHEAARRTLATAGTAVITSGLTVLVGFAALLIPPMVETRSIGLSGLVVVAVAVLLSTTLLPALLAVLGRAIDTPRWLAKRLAWYHAPTIWERWARSLSRHPYRALTLGGVGVLLLTAPVFLIKIGLPSRHWWPTATEAGRGAETLSAMGASGIMLPIRVLVEVPEGEAITTAARLRGLRNLTDSLAADPRVGRVTSLMTVRKGASLLEYSVLYSDLPAARADLGDFLDAYLGADQRIALVDVFPADTTTLTTSMQLVRDIRAIRDAPIRGLKGTSIIVGGYTAAATDFQDDLLRVFPLLIGVVLGVTALMLAIAFRSVLVPIKAIVMNSLSVSATFGLSVLVFQYGWGAGLLGLDGPTSAIYVVVPVMVFAIVFGLSMDYEVFLLSRIKEAYDRTGRNKEATMEGLSATASVITSAALVMILVFGAFAFARVLMVQFLGFGLAVAVLLDATIIRMVLVPAFMHLAGRWNWWPGVRQDLTPED